MQRRVDETALLKMATWVPRDGERERVGSRGFMGPIAIAPVTMLDATIRMLTDVEGRQDRRGEH